MDYAIFDKISCFVFDVDGVLTDQTVLVTESGELLRRMNVRDGQAIKYALEAGYRIAIFTKGNSQGVKKRLQGLGIKDIYDALEHKEAAFDSYMKEHSVDLSEVVYMGDDLPDLVLLRKVGLPTCPSNAAVEVRRACTFVSGIQGGHGCVRDLIERVMRCQGKWPA